MLEDSVRLFKDWNPGAFAVSVPCVSEKHEGHRMFVLAYGFADLDGAAFKDYYCDKCARRDYPDAVEKMTTNAVVDTE